MWVMQRSITTATLAGVKELPKPDRAKNTSPLVGFYRTADNRYLALSMLSAQRYWGNFCRAVGRQDLADDPRFDTDAGRAKNAAVCIAELEAIFAARPLSEWMTILATQEGQWDVVQHPGELQYDRQVIANNYMQDVHYDDGRMLKMVSTPIQFDREAFPPRPAPDVGAHSEEVLAELGFNDDQIIDLKVAGIVF
jgi:crotonobetainyl-CoA:carnitine CoA-transferase CaiB-like acyl-CoA transferase